MKPAAQSSFDVVNWFVERGREHGIPMTPTLIQRLLYLAQTFYAGNNGGAALMPLVFVAEKDGPIAHDLARAFEHGPPTVTVHDLPPDICEFLDGIWAKFAGRPADALDRLVCLDPAFQEAEGLGFGATITGAMTQDGDEILEPETGERIIDGKRVRPWSPKVVLPIRN